MTPPDQACSFGSMGIVCRYWNTHYKTTKIMPMKTTHLIFLILVPVLCSCQKEPVKEAAAPGLTESRRQEILNQGGEASAALLASLGPQLKAALTAGGPVHALTVCQQLAQPSTKEVSGRMTGITLTRVSLKPRNPKNAPDRLDTEVLTAWHKQIADQGKSPSDEVRMKDGKSAVFYRPIMIQDVCLKCHGDPGTFSETLLEQLAKLYPDDMATGYTKGGLRGAFRVEFPPETD
jgi:hypothetical protein